MFFHYCYDDNVQTPNLLKHILVSCLAIAIFLALPSVINAQVFASTFYVAPSGSDSNQGTELAPWRTIQHAATVMQAGDTTIIRGGTYAEQVTPAQSGTAAQPIVYQAYPGELPIIDGNNTIYRNIDILNRSYLVFDGLRVEEPVDSWVRVENSNNITFRNMVFANPTYPTTLRRSFQGLYFRYSHHNQVLNSTLEYWGRYQEGDNEGNNIRIVGDASGNGSNNLIEGNTFRYCANSCLMINSSNNLVRNNTFDNEWQKGIEVSWMTNPGDEPVGTDWPAVGNVIENNQFVRFGQSQYGHGGYSMAVVGSENIIRRNVMRNGDHLGMFLNTIDPYATHHQGNLVYNNTIVNNGLDRFEWLGTGISATNFGSSFQLNSDSIKNNILWGNLPGAGNNPFQLSLEITGPGNTAPYGNFTIAGNLIQNLRPAACYPTSGDCPFIIVGSSPNTANIATLNTLNPLFYANHEGHPQFVQYDATNSLFDLHLSSGSAAIDTGVALTTTVGTGSGTTITVANDRYFHDGLGLTAGDSVMVGSEQVTITAIDRIAHTLTVDRSITWADQTAVNLPFSGAAPDSGVYEFASVGGPSPSPTPSPVPTPSPTPSPSPSPIPTPSPSPSPTVEPSPSPTPTPVPTPSPTPTPTVVPTPTPTPTPVPTPSPTPTPTPTPVPTPSPTPTPTPTPTPSPSPSPSPSTNIAYLSLNTAATLGGTSYADEDIVQLNTTTGQYQMHFDGSDVGLAGTNLDAFTVLPNGHILFSTSTEIGLAGIGSVYPEDVTEFVPTTLGTTTAGTFVRYFDGSNVGLYTTEHNVDGIAVLPDNRVLVSTTGRYTVMGLPIGEDEDIIALTPTSLGTSTAGTWSIYFDGSDVGLSTNANEDVNAFYIDSTGRINLSTVGAFAVTGISGANEDIFVFTPTSLGSTTSGTYATQLGFDGSLFGLSSYNVDGFFAQN